MVNTPRDISGDDTVAMGSGASARGTLVRYQLRAVLSRVVADCERLIEGLTRPERRAWRDALGDALVGARHLLSLVDYWLKDDAGPETVGRMNTFYAEMVEPQHRVVQALTTLLSFVPTEPEDELMLEDARYMIERVLRLAGVDGRPEGPLRRALSDSQASPVLAGRQKASLLVVDDDPSSRRALSHLLAHLGYEVTAAEHGAQGLEMALREMPDLVLSDITMPEMDGFELLRRLKGDDRTRRIPVIMVSGLDDIRSVVRCIEQGADDHLTKPYESILLQARVRASLERKRMRDVELAYLGRVAKLTAAAESVERGTYEPGSLESLSAEPDELGRLSRVFDRMVANLKSKEEQLQNRLRELRREIRQSRGISAARRSGAVSQESPFAAGDVLADRYEIMGELGKGGMGMVYLAQDRKLGEDVAMKVLRNDLVGQDPTLVERLKSEIRLARKISHRNVVRAHDWGEWRGAYFITMEYVKGISVADLLQERGRLTIESTLAIGTQLAEALAVAHEQHIIHRDIKPANLLVDDEGTLKVMDFGLARPAQRVDELTQRGFVVGTPRYMSPEQIFGSEVDGRSDLFAAGVVMYECLTGSPPFDASSPMGVIAQVIEGKPTPIQSVVPAAPSALVAVIERLLEREPRDRPGSARELMDELAQVGQTRLR